MTDRSPIARASTSLRESLTRSLDVSDRRIKLVGILYATVGVLHGVVDPGISYIGIEILARASEANPSMRGSMQRGLGVFVLTHLPLYLFVGVAHVLTVEFMTTEFNHGTQSTYYAAVTGLSLVVSWGVCLNLWNIAVLLTAR
jgi:hypothetical protein